MNTLKNKYVNQFELPHITDKFCESCLDITHINSKQPKAEPYIQNNERAHAENTALECRNLSIPLILESSYIWTQREKKLTLAYKGNNPFIINIRNIKGLNELTDWFFSIEDERKLTRIHIHFSFTVGPRHTHTLDLQNSLNKLALAAPNIELIHFENIYSTLYLDNFKNLACLHLPLISNFYDYSQEKEYPGNVSLRNLPNLKLVYFQKSDKSHAPTLENDTLEQFNLIKPPFNSFSSSELHFYVKKTKK